MHWHEQPKLRVQSQTYYGVRSMDFVRQLPGFAMEPGPYPVGSNSI